MDQNRYLRRKWTLRAEGQKVVFVKSPRERSEHVFMKIFIWGLYIPIYPDMLVETRIGDRYKPDVVSLNIHEEPLFWGESGKVSKDKIHSLAKRFRNTHFAIAKWDMNLDPLETIVREAVDGLKRPVPFDLLKFTVGDEERFIDDKGNVKLSFDELIDWRRIES